MFCQFVLGVGWEGWGGSWEGVYGVYSSYDNLLLKLFKNVTKHEVRTMLSEIPDRIIGEYEKSTLDQRGIMISQKQISVMLALHRIVDNIIQSPWRTN